MVSNNVLKYLQAVALLGLAAGFRVALDPWLGDSLSHPTIFTVVLITAWYLGLGPAVANTIIGYPLIQYLVLDTPLSEQTSGYIAASLTLYLGLNLIIIFFVRRFRRERDLLAEAQTRLQQSEERLRGSFANAALGIVEAGENNRFSAVNQRMCEILGCGPEDVLGKTISEITAPEDRELSDRLNASLQRGEVPRLDYEKRYLRADGSPIWVHLTVSAVRDRDGRYLRSVGTVEDISARKAAEELLKRSNAELEAERARWKGVVEGIADEVWICDRDGQISLMNLPPTTAMRLPEFSNESIDQVLARVEICYPDGSLRPPEEAPLFRSLRTGEIVRGEEIMRELETGRSRHRQFSCAPTRDGAGGITGAVAIVRDITELREAEAQLRESERRYRIVADHTYDWEFWLGPDGAVLYSSPSCVQVTGYESADFAADPDLIERIIHPEDRELWAEHRGGPTGRCLSSQAEFRIVRRDGQVRWIEHVCLPLYDGPGGEFLGVRGSNRDITDRKKLESELRAAMHNAESAKQAAEEANVAKDQFLAVLSHELRTPLTPVLAAVQLMRRRAGLDDELREFLEIIQRNLELEARLIDDLLDLTRIVRGKVALERRPIDLRPVIDRVVEICRPDIEARKLNLAVEIGDGALTIHADPSRIQQVMWNVLKNSIKFTPDGGRIGVKCYLRDSEVCVEVADNGIGIENEALERIFNAFEQADQVVARQFGGLGLGLAISKRLVELHDGTISAFSAGKGQGALFTISFPGAADQKASADVAQSGKSVPVAHEASVLLVEDHGDTAMIMRRLLCASGYSVETASDTAQALALIAEKNFDLLVSDLGLPDRSGLELMREIRDQGIPIKAIALSGFGREEDIAMSLEAGFLAHLTKPVSFDVLVELMAKLSGLAI